ncbi:MAG: flagellar basal body rod protein FlgC [Acidobacteriota bacterium]
MSQLLSAVNAAASALDAQRARMEVAVSNMANAESTQGPNGTPYRRRDVVLAAVSPDAFGQALGQANGGNADGVRVVGVVEDQTPFQKRYEPGHPQADKDGFVEMPNVDVPEEMVNLLSAARAYQANLTAIGLIRDTVQKALELAK